MQKERAARDETAELHSPWLGPGSAAAILSTAAGGKGALLGDAGPLAAGAVRAAPASSPHAT